MNLQTMVHFGYDAKILGCTCTADGWLKPENESYSDAFMYVKEGKQSTFRPNTQTKTSDLGKRPLYKLKIIILKLVSSRAINKVHKKEDELD